MFINCSTSPSAITLVASASTPARAFDPSEHHLECARIEEVADQHAGRIAEDLVGGRASAAQRGLVHHVVVQQCRRVDELDDRRQFEALPPA